MREKEEKETFPCKLNVVFHGPFLFAYYPGRLEAITPQIAEHSVIAGTWLKEKPCAQGSYYLTGISPQNPSAVDPDTHVVFQRSQVEMGDGSYYRFVLPIPSSQKALAAATLPDDGSFFEGNDAGSIEADTIGTAHAIIYEITQDDRPQLDGLQWLPEPNKYPLDGPFSFAINLHVYADSVFLPDPEHAFRDFQSIVKMVPGLSLGLSRPVPDLQFKDPNDDGTLGLAREEQGGVRGLPRQVMHAFPPLICDSPSLVVVGAQDPNP